MRKLTNSKFRSLGTVAAVVLIAMALPTVSNAGASPQADAAVAAPALDAGSPSVGHRFADMKLELISRTFNAGPNNFTIVAEATLSSNFICLRIWFNCIVGEVSSPSNATMVDLQCQSPLWNHLLVFRDHCLKEIFHAGHDQKFQFTYDTDPGVISGNVDLNVEFGRGFLPVQFDQEATASLTVNLDEILNVSKECPTDVASGAAVTCTVTVSNPTAGPASLASLTDVPGGTFVTGGTLTETGTSDWACAALTCTIDPVPAGVTTVFTYAGTAATTTSGGEGSNAAQLTWTGGSDNASDTITIIGDDDADMTIEKSTTQASATAGGSVTWTVTLTNLGGSTDPIDAADVVLTDITPDLVSDLTLTYESGVGTWDCAALTCTAAAMPVGTATFAAAGTVDASATVDAALVNEADVLWTNNILGPDFPLTAGSVLSVVAGATTTSTTPSGTPSAAPISFVG